MKSDAPGHLRRTLRTCGAALVVGGWLFVAGLSPGWADEVRLRNGDRLTGTIVTMEEGALTVNTVYGGNLKLDWSEVESLSADQPLSVQLKNEVDDADWIDWLYTRYQTVSTTRLAGDLGPSLDDVRAINPPPPIRYQGTLNVGGNRTQGNTNTQAVNASTRWSVRSDRHRMLAEGKYNYGEVGRTVTVRNTMATLKYDFFFTRKIFGNAEGLLEKDTFQNLTLRTTLGGGLGYQFVDTKRATVSAVAGLAYVGEDYTNAPQTTTAAGRWSLRVELALIPDRVKFFHKHEGFYDFGERGALRVFADQGLRITVLGNLFLNLEYDVRYNGATAPGRRRTDETLIFGVGYEFKS